MTAPVFKTGVLRFKTNPVNWIVNKVSARYFKSRIVQLTTSQRANIGCRTIGRGLCSSPGNIRYASFDGQLRKVMMAQKMRRSSHSIDMFAYEISVKGLVIGEPMRG